MTYSEKKKLNVILQIEENKSVFVDKDIAINILRNLVYNAIKFTDEGGEIIIKSDDHNEFIEIAVIDNGIGISEEDQKKLFKLETDYKKAGDSYEKGTGLGLVLCKEFVEKSGGKIWFSSTEHKGSDFRFTLPKAKDKTVLDERKEF